MTFPFWFWFITTTVGLGSIAISTFVVVYMKFAELDAREAAVKSNDATRGA
jgi:hypothetical protein